MTCHVITGPTAGIGRAITLQIPQAGDSVALVARDEAALAELARALADRGVRAETLAADVRERDAPEHIAELAAALGGADVLVNNAGGAFQARLEEVSLNGWRSVMSLNLDAPFAISNALFPQLRDSEGGVILNVGSAAGTFADPGFGPYATAKAGLHHLTRHQAVEWAKHGIRANVIAPGPVSTERSRWSKPEGRALAQEVTALGRPMDVKEIASCAAYLVSPEAGAVTGAIFAVDGGFLGWPPYEDH